MLPPIEVQKASVEYLYLLKAAGRSRKLSLLWNNWNYYQSANTQKYHAWAGSQSPHQRSYVDYSNEFLRKYVDDKS